MYCFFLTLQAVVKDEISLKFDLYSDGFEDFNFVLIPVITFLHVAACTYIFHNCTVSVADGVFFKLHYFWGGHSLNDEPSVHPG